MPVHNRKLYAQGPMKLNAHQKAVLTWMRQRVVQIDSEMFEYPFMRNMDLIARFAPGMDARSYRKREHLADMVLNQLKFRPSKWQFLMIAFYKCPETGVEQFSTELLPTFHGTAAEFSAHVAPTLNAFLDEARNTNFVTYATAAFPTDTVEVDEVLQDEIIEVLAKEGCYDRERVSQGKMVRQLTNMD